MEPEWVTTRSAPPEVQRYLDKVGRVVSWPEKNRARGNVLAYLATHFCAGRVYSEHEMNDVLLRALACRDYASVRRDLCDPHHLARERDGSRYWRVQT
jgi:hypothetical protein